MNTEGPKTSIHPPPSPPPPTEGEDEEDGEGGDRECGEGEEAEGGSGGGVNGVRPGGGVDVWRRTPLPFLTYKELGTPNPLCVLSYHLFKDYLKMKKKFKL